MKQDISSWPERDAGHYEQGWLDGADSAWWDGFRSGLTVATVVFVVGLVVLSCWPK